MVEEGSNLIPNKQILIESSTYCGAECLMCPRQSASYKWAHMPFDIFTKAIKQAVELGVVSLNFGGFGDCFMDPEFGEKLKYAKKNFPRVNITCATTCHLISGKNLNLASVYIDMLKISMYGFSKESYEKVHRGSLKYENIIENINNILLLPKGKRPYILMSYLMLPENKHEIEGWKKHWQPRADEIIVWMPHNWAGGYLKHEKRITKKAGGAKSCGRPFAGDFVVHPEGEISVCCFDFNRQLIIGDLNKDSLNNILTGDALAKIRDAHMNCNFTESGLICKNCDQLMDRKDALIYASNKNRKVGAITTLPDFISDNYSYIPKC